MTGLPGQVCGGSLIVSSDQEGSGSAMTDANEICRMDTVTLARRIKAKELSPVEVVEAVLGRLEHLDPVLHAFATVTADQARAEARRMEQDIAAGRGPDGGQGPDLHQGCPHRLRVIRLRRFHPR